MCRLLQVVRGFEVGAFAAARSPMTAFAHGMRAMRAGSDPDDD